MRKAHRWNGMDDRGRPARLYHFQDAPRQAKAVFADGSFIRFACWQCALKSKKIILTSDVPTKVLVDDDF